MGDPVSAWGQVRKDTLDRIANLTPTVDSAQKWRHLGPTRDEDLQGATTRQFTSSSEDVTTEEDRVAGAGERQERWLLALRTYYLPSENVDDQLAADHVDLINALHATSTYPSGSWGALRVRKVLEPERDEGEQGLTIVIHRVALTFRFGVTLT